MIHQRRGFRHDRLKGFSIADIKFNSSLATGLAEWYACLPFGTGMLVAIALVSHFVEMIAKLVKNDRGEDRFGCYFCILSTYCSLART